MGSRGRGRVLQASAGGAERMGEGGSGDGREGFTGSAYPKSGEKTKASVTTERQIPSEPHWVLSTLHR